MNLNKKDIFLRQYVDILHSKLLLKSIMIELKNENIKLYDRILKTLDTLYKKYEKEHLNNYSDEELNFMIKEYFLDNTATIEGIENFIKSNDKIKSILDNM